MAEPQHITLRELQRSIRRTIDERFALPLWVSAEIAELKVNHSGHCYLELIEKGGREGIPVAQARAVIWGSAFPRIEGYFEAETGRRLEAGLKVLVRALVSYHEIYGFSLQISDIDPSYTLGDMERQRQQTILRLQSEGVWEMNRQCPLPLAPQRIAVVSSARAAGYRDFVKELEHSPYHFRLTLFDAFVQGAAAEETIVAALCAVAARQEEFDVVAIIRGGGSRSDLGCFDAYRLCTHIAQFPLPVITGIGHDKDTSVADMVAHRALKTPTAVAGFLIGALDRVAAACDAGALRLRDALRSRTQGAALRLEQAEVLLRSLASARLAGASNRLESASGSLADAAEALLARHRVRLENAAAVIAAHDPDRVLRLGFALLRSAGRAVTSAHAVAPGDPLEIELRDGALAATVNHIRYGQERT